MMTIGLACASLAIATGFGTGSAVPADGMSPTTEVPRASDEIPERDRLGLGGIAGDDRSAGLSFGTADNRCGDLSGGLSDGNGSRNR